MRLIDADALLEDKVSNAYISRFEIKQAPTVDAVVLPYKVGDTVYWISPFKSGVCQGEVTCILISGFGFDLHILNNGNVVKREVEKVLPTRKEAEQALSHYNSHENELDWDSLKGGAE